MNSNMITCVKKEQASTENIWHMLSFRTYICLVKDHSPYLNLFPDREDQCQTMEEEPVYTTQVEIIIHQTTKLRYDHSGDYRAFPLW